MPTFTTIVGVIHQIATCAIGAGAQFTDLVVTTLHGRAILTAAVAIEIATLFHGRSVTAPGVANHTLVRGAIIAFQLINIEHKRPWGPSAVHEDVYGLANVQENADLAMRLCAVVVIASQL